MKSNDHPFRRNGFALLSDLKSAEWMALFNKLNTEQSSFLQQEDSFRSPEYIWPRDPLNTWSRVWEYPFVFHALDELRSRVSDNKLLRVVDFGSGVTFFPFSVARAGYDVTCVDIDPICARDIPAASCVIDSSPGNVGVSLLKDGKMMIPDESLDALYSISVLEHIDVAKFALTIKEISRVLKPRGCFILTIDIDLRGNSEIGIEGLRELMSEINLHFSPHYSPHLSHPADYLTNINGPNGLKRIKTTEIAKHLLRSTLRGRPLWEDPRVDFHLTVYGSVFTKL